MFDAQKSVRVLKLRIMVELDTQVKYVRQTKVLPWMCKKRPHQKNATQEKKTMAGRGTKNWKTLPMLSEEWRGKVEIALNVVTLY